MKFFRCFNSVAQVLSYMLVGVVILLTAASNVRNAAIISLIFLMVHEGAHLTAARLLGYKVDKAAIHALPFGFRMGFSDRFKSPVHELVVIGSGPLMNLALAATFALIASLIDNNLILMQLCKVNLVLGLFNLIPAGFLDGGRALRVLIAMLFSFYYAQLVVDLSGAIFGAILLWTAMYVGVTLYAIPVFLLAAYFPVWSYVQMKRRPLLLLDYMLDKNSNLGIKTRIRINLVCYMPETKLLDIIKNFCFNKYYVIYIMDNGILRYNINETDLICLFCRFGNIKLKDCVNYTEEQEDNDG